MASTFTTRIHYSCPHGEVAVSIRSFRHISPDQRTGFVSALIAVFTLAITATSPYFFLTVPIAIIIGAALLYVYAKTIVRKELYFEFTDFHSVLEKLTFITPSIEKRITILYDNRTPVTVGQLYTLLLTVHNEGNILIEKEDFSNRRILIKLPAAMKILDADIRGNGLVNSTLDKPDWTDSNVFISPFSLAVRKSIKIRLTLYCAGLNPGDELKNIAIPAEGNGEGSNFAFKIFGNGGRWEEKLGKKARKRNRLLFTSLLILSFFSLALWCYVWFFPDSRILLFHLPVQYQLLLTVLLTIPYFGLILSMFFNRTVPSSTT